MAGTYQLREPNPMVTTSPDAPTSGAKSKQAPPPGRLTSLDAYRGFIMFVLAASGFGLADFAEHSSLAESDVWQRVYFHFEHPDWRSNFAPQFVIDAGLDTEAAGEFLKFGVSFWDLIQPAFMFMVGVAMPFSYARREATGQSDVKRGAHALWRALVLVLLAVFLSTCSAADSPDPAERAEHILWIFPNVLAQIGLGYGFLYFLLLGRRQWFQFVILGLILVGYWGAFKMHTPPEGYDYEARNASAEKGEVYEGAFAPWSKNANGAHGFDIRFLNLLRTLDDEVMKEHGIARDARSWAPEPVRQCLFQHDKPFLFNKGGYQTLNFVPSIATMLLGMLCGQLLLNPMNGWKKLGFFIGAGLVCMLLGLLAGQFACPIVKRIWTPSWVLFSGAYVIWMLALFYLVFDLLPLKVLAFPLVVVGMNSIVMYMMGQLIRGFTIDYVINLHLGGVLELCFGAEALSEAMYGHIIYKTAAAIVFWLIAFTMYRQRLFVRV